MPRQTGIPAALKKYGVKYETVPGWRTRGSASFNPKGVVCHWTAGPRNAKGRPSLNVVTYGRPGLSGPLCQVYLDRNGVAVVVAAGRANHAGSGGYKGLSGNSSVFGIEAECGGDGDWTAAQRREYPKVVAALLSLTGRSEKYVCGHNEWTTRKIDIRDWTMSRMRSEVRAIRAGKGFKPGEAGGGGGGSTYESAKAKHAVGSRVMGLYDGGTDVRWLQEQLKKLKRYKGGKVDGLFGPALKSAVEHYQKSRGLAVDGLAGKDTIGALKSGKKKVAAPKPAPKPKGESFPLSKGHWYGVESSNPKNHSGYWPKDRAGIRQLQQGLRGRNWKITVDGRYGPATRDIVRAFQKKAGIRVDGAVGAETWAAIFNKPLMKK